MFTLNYMLKTNSIGQLNYFPVFCISLSLIGKSVNLIYGGRNVRKRERIICRNGEYYY